MTRKPPGPMHTTPGTVKPQVRQQILEEMLICSGRYSYGKTSVELLCRECGIQRSTFRRHFSSKAECFHSAYLRGSERLVQRLLPAEDGAVWNLPLALGDLAEFLASEPMKARALLVEIHAVGDPSLRRRLTLMHRLARALDACYRTESSPAPDATSLFMIHAIDHVARSALVAGEPARFPREIPGLLTLVGEAYGTKISLEAEISVS